MEICLEKRPDFTELSDTHKVSCWLQHPEAPKIVRPSGLGGNNNE